MVLLANPACVCVQNTLYVHFITVVGLLGSCVLNWKEEGWRCCAWPTRTFAQENEGVTSIWQPRPNPCVAGTEEYLNIFILVNTVTYYFCSYEC